MAQITLGSQDNGITIDIAKKGVSFFAANANQANQFMKMIGESVDEGVPMLFVGNDEDIPSHRKFVRLEGIVPGLDIGPDRTASIILGYVASPFSKETPRPLVRNILKLATAFSAMLHISYMSALTHLSSLSAVIKAGGSHAPSRTIDTDDSGLDWMSRYSNLLDELTSRIPGYIESVGQNQRKDVAEFYDLAFREVEAFREKAKNDLIEGLDLNFSGWDNVRKPVKEIVINGEMMVFNRYDVSYGGTIAWAIAQCCNDMSLAMVVLSGPSEIHLTFPSTMYLTNRVDNFEYLSSSVFYTEAPASMAQFLDVTNFNTVLAVDEVVLPYQSMETLDPDGYRHFNRNAFGKSHQPGPYGEAAMQMEKIEFLQRIRLHLASTDDEARVMIDEETAKAEQELTAISKFIVGSVRQAFTSDTIHVAHGKALAPRTIQHELFA